MLSDIVGTTQTSNLTLLLEHLVASEFFSCNIFLTSEEDKSFTITIFFISSTEIKFQSTIMKGILMTCGAVEVFLPKDIHTQETDACGCTYCIRFVFYVVWQQKIHLNVIYDTEKYLRYFAIKIIIG